MSAEPKRVRVAEPTVVTTLYANAWEMLIAAAAVISSVAFFINPGAVTSPALHATLRGWDWAWYGLYLLGGLFIISGLLLHGRTVRIRGRIIAGDGRVELAGLSFFGTALLVNVIAIIHFGFAGTVGMLTFLCLLLACIARARVIVAIRKAYVAHAVPGKDA